ncbi:hypothetical protein BU25DRAFT_426813 [Macroventuria anomochaeta]|uniref:Uncharacterized protein n=1 Tax=Macroventuria anomochaeta TaxID=301207 RepID=A0ACB6SGP1_9PLEO|nr:uncharacterized protein BU25DRAFT_426813 [Macroventuria anomochaeta]KAF2633199.1 hypothetical protein BU25DRAFT_426813 [Macroventuria anomochaeta]
MSSSSAPLAPAQTHALFDILIHHQIYAEIEAFKHPSTIDHYGHPFRKADGVQTTSPLLQNMLNKFALTNPALKNLGNNFWQDKIQTLVAKMAEAELSESYDKGAIGSRKALATAASSLAEYIGRGMLGGYPVAQRKDDGKKQYDTSKPEDVLEAWDECTRSFIYGDLLDQLLVKVTATDKLEDHSSLVQAGHEFILLNVASFLHHVFVMSPDGQYLVRLLENIHRLIPYYMIKQTLRIGNAASMVNGMVRLILAKLSVTAMTNWIGLTNNSNDGMNLMQQIISTILAWDTAEFQKRASKLESSRDAPDKKVIKAIKAHVYASRDRHEAARNMSIQEKKSIIAVILETADTPIKPDSLKDQQHDIAMEYYSTYLSIRDREEITKVFCKSNPDVLTSAVRDCVSAMDPVIRAIHNAVDLSSTVTDAENFITDLIKASKPKKKSGRKSRETSKEREANASNVDTAPASVTDTDNGDAPTVEDFVVLLRKHAPSMHKFLHQVTKNAPELAHDYLVYAKQIFGEFKADEQSREGSAGNMTAPLHSLFETLPKDKQDELKKLLDEHASHLSELKATSQSRLESIMKNGETKGSTHGPGMYLSRWNALLDSTLISPATVSGPVRRGWEVKGELDGKGLKTSSALQSSKGGKTSNGVSIANGLGDAQDRKERKRDGMEEDKMMTVWEAMRDGWVGVCRGLEVMGSD